MKKKKESIIMYGGYIAPIWMHSFLREQLEISISQGDLIHKCCEVNCDRYRVGDAWFPSVIPNDYNNISHGLCTEHFLRGIAKDKDLFDRIVQKSGDDNINFFFTHTPLLFDYKPKRRGGQ